MILTSKYFSVVEDYIKTRNVLVIHEFYTSLDEDTKNAIGEVPFLFYDQVDFSMSSFAKHFTDKTGVKLNADVDGDSRRMSHIPELFVAQRLCLLYHH